MSEQGVPVPTMLFVPVALICHNNVTYLAVSNEDGVLFHKIDNGHVSMQCWPVKSSFAEKMRERLEPHSFSLANVNCEWAEVFLAPWPVWWDIVSWCDYERACSLIFKKALENLRGMHLFADEISINTQYVLST